MPASNPTTGECSDRNLQTNRDNRGGFHFFLFCWAQSEVGAHTASMLNTLVIERICWLAETVAFALHGLAHVFFMFLFSNS